MSDDRVGFGLLGAGLIAPFHARALRASSKTRLVAEELAKLLGADLEEIQENKDRSGMLGFLSGGRDATLHRPSELISRHSREPRRIVVLGMPVWAWGPPPALRAYLAAYPLGPSGQAAGAGPTEQPPAGAARAKVCAFCTHGGGGGKRTFSTLGELVGGELALTFEWKNPGAGDPVLMAAIKEWAEKIKIL